MAEEQQDAPLPQPYAGQIVRLGFPYAPIGWLRCDGQKLPKDQYAELFSVIGTTYGGDATNFALPELRSGVPIGASPAYPLGQRGGGVFVTLTPDQLPQHRHLVKVLTQPGTVASPHSEHSLSSEGPSGITLVYTYAPYDTAANLVALNKTSITSSEGHSHENRQPFLPIVYAISAFTKPMSEPFLGQIALFPFDFAPANWAPCRGQLLPINQNTALFSLLGTIYGGDGVNNFALPDLRGRVATGVLVREQGSDQGKPGGFEQVALDAKTNARHNHALNATTKEATTSIANGNLPAYAFRAASRTSGNSGMIYTTSNLLPNSGLAATTITSAGRSKPHNNIQPYLTLSYCISLAGDFPTRN